MADITAKDIRDFFQDSPDKNLKHMKTFFSTEVINTAIKIAKSRVDDSLPHIAGVTFSTLPYYIALECCAAEVIGIKLNNLGINYSKGVVEHGLQLDIGEEYRALAERRAELLRSFEEAFYKYKQGKNIAGALGVITSPYNRITRSRSR